MEGEGCGRVVGLLRCNIAAQLGNPAEAGQRQGKLNMSGHARTRDMGTSPSVFVEAHIKGRPKKKRASPSKSRKMLLLGMVESTWRTLPVGEKIAWVKEVKDIEEERRRSPLSMAAAAPPGPWQARPWCPPPCRRPRPTRSSRTRSMGSLI